MEMKLVLKDCCKGIAAEINERSQKWEWNK